MIKAFFLPTDCKLCYWGRMAIAGATGVELGTGLGRVAEIPLVTIAVLAVAAKWLVTKYS